MGLDEHSAWQITHYQVKSDGTTPYERLREIMAAKWRNSLRLSTSEILRRLRRRRSYTTDGAFVLVWKDPSIIRTPRGFIGRSPKMSIHLEAPRKSTLEQESAERDDRRSSGPDTLEGETTDATRSVHYGGPSDQVMRHEKMPSMLRACESAFTGVSNAISGYRGQRSCTNGSSKCR